MGVFCHYINKEYIFSAREVVKDIKGAFRSMLTTATWMGSAREEALRKVDNMLMLVGYPDLLKNETSLEEYHSSLPKMNEQTHFENMMALSRWHSLRSLARLRKPVVRDGWARGPVETNAFYSTLQNSIIIPVAVLQPPIFRREPLTALNYGALGVVIGHEITHGFDNSGRERDHEGNLHEWWTAETDAEYASRSRCFADQYEAFDVSQILSPYERDGAEVKSPGLLRGDALVSVRLGECAAESSGRGWKFLGVCVSPVGVGGSSWVCESPVGVAWKFVDV
ncbi:neprilysin-1-like [Penaeus chinensis]|uniref:neprilysin-1-like n=1 Tax=Penaeus chinensis TaxID=139456 RepID=UPI001FB5F8E6|nr:neprilysin-1-like [Penaeus chinensis]